MNLTGITLGSATLRAHIDWRFESSWFADYVHNKGTKQVPSNKGDFERLTRQPEVYVDADLWTRFAELILSPVRRHHQYSNFSARRTLP